jgi:hypothetical protein
MLQRIRERKNRWLFGRAVRRILDTPPARTGNAPLTVLSMCNHRDVLAYLLALKSFMQQVGARKVVLVADPTLTPDDRALIAGHVPGIEIRPAADCRDPRMPIGGTWERIIAIADEARSSYVVQLDADTVTLGPLPEVIECAHSGAAFVLASDDQTRIMPCAEMAEVARSLAGADSHIQGLGEANLAAFAATHGRYARGCSGFAGFPRESFSRDTLGGISELMRSLVGDRWAEWGSEQFTSNLIAASCSNAIVLPHPKYCNAHRATEESVLLHFIGYARYFGPAYSQRAAEVIQRLLNREVVR